MTSKDNVGLFIGRLQPPHLGHEKALKKYLSEVDELIIGIGSAEKHHTSENPFTCEERTYMLQSALGESQGKIRIVPIPDINDYSRWVSHVENLVGEFDLVYTGNQVVAELFSQKGYNISPIKEEIYISSSAIRDMMARGADWKKYVSSGVAEYLEKIGGENRVRSLYKQYLNPIPAVDAVIEYEEGIILIKRKDGEYALPGGFMEFGESAEAAAAREAKEETNLNFSPERLIGVYSDPKRDKRTHIISIAFAGKGYGELKAGDDAKGITRVSLEEALRMELYADHNKILEDYANIGNYILPTSYK